MWEDRKATHIQTWGNHEIVSDQTTAAIRLSLTVQNVENFVCLIFVTKGVQALSNSILR